MTSTSHCASDCARAWDAMPWALLGQLAVDDDRWLRQHIAGCTSCREEFARQQMLRRAVSLPPPIQVDAEAGLQRLLARLEAAPSARAAGWRAGAGLSRILVAAVLVQAVGLGVLGATLWSMDRPAYRTLSQASAPRPADAIRLLPEAAMSLGEWDALLQALDLQVVAGPNDVGAYTVVARAPMAATRRSLLQRLRANPRIRLAEPVAAAP